MLVYQILITGNSKEKLGMLLEGLEKGVNEKNNRQKEGKKNSNGSLTTQVIIMVIRVHENEKCYMRHGTYSLFKCLSRGN